MAHLADVSTRILGGSMLRAALTLLIRRDQRFCIASASAHRARPGDRRLIRAGLQLRGGARACQWSAVRDRAMSDTPQKREIFDPDGIVDGLDSSRLPTCVNKGLEKGPK
jgi:hypothetical protein